MIFSLSACTEIRNWWNYEAPVLKVNCFNSKSWRLLTVAALCSSCSLQKYLERWRKASNEAARSVSVDDNEETRNPENWNQYISLATALSTVYANSSTLEVGIIASVCGLPNPPLNWSSSSVPPGTTSTIRSPRGPRRIQHFCIGVTPRSLMVGEGLLGLYASCVLPPVIFPSLPLWHMITWLTKFTFGPLWHVLTRPQWIASELYSVGIITRIAANELAIWL